MLSALIYLQTHLFVNRIGVRLRRLKEPKYLFGAIAGGAYFYFYFFRHFFGRANTFGSPGLFTAPGDLVLYQSAGALILLVLVAGAWLIPHQRAALAFSEAEVAFLFPAPVTRRGLIHFKLARSQAGILLTIVVLLAVTARFGGRFWIRAMGWWIILSTLSLHFLGASFARTLLLDRGISNGRRRLAVLAVLAALFAIVAVWTIKAFPHFERGHFDTGRPLTEQIETMKDAARQILVSGPLPWLLYPFRIVIQPYLAPSARAFFLALGPGLLMLALHYWWVARSDVAFEEASLDASKRLADRVAAMRQGNWRAAGAKQKGKRAPFELRPDGPAFVALVWKNILNVGQAFTMRTWTVLAFTAILLCFVLRGTIGASGVQEMLGILAAMLAAWSLLLGPQFLRQDFRQDLPFADVLKTFPLKGWQVALGEVLGPAAILTGLQWLLLAFAAGMLVNEQGSWHDAPVLSIVVGAAMVLPAMNLIMAQIPNAAVLLFPAWFQTGKEAPHGIEATGQRLIFMLGQLIVLGFALLPAGIAFGAVLFGARMLLSTALAVPLASAAAAVALAGEAALGFLVLGWLFERYDVAGDSA